jgi:hypothetical protein
MLHNWRKSMFTYISPTSYMKTPEGRLAGILLVAGIGAAACGGSTNADISASTASVSSQADCNTGETVSQGGTTLYCEELQSSSADVFRDYKDLFNSKDPNQLHVGQTVLVRCVQAAPLAIASTAHGNHGDPYSEWYVLAEPGEFKDGFTAANDFWNVDEQKKADFIRDHTPLNQQPAVDQHVPSCGPPIK